VYKRQGMGGLIEFKPELLASAVDDDHLFVCEQTLNGRWRDTLKDDRVLSTMHLDDDALLGYGGGQSTTTFDFW